MSIIKRDLFYTFLISLITGFVGQTLIPLLASSFCFTHWDFSGLISNIDIYPLAIVIMICMSNQGSKHVLFRIVTYFVGLCLGYYGWTSGLDIYHSIVQNNSSYLYNILSDILDTVMWIIIALLAGVWGYFTIKFESNKVLFYILITPFAIVELLSAYNNLTTVYVNIIMAIIDLFCLIGIILVVRIRTKNSELS